MRHTDIADSTVRIICRCGYVSWPKPLVKIRRKVDAKPLSPGEVLQRHRELAAQYGHQADRVVAPARQHGQYQMPEQEVQAKQAVTWARDHVFERSAVQDRRAILETALVRGMGETTYAQVRQEFERRIEAGESGKSRTLELADSTRPP